MGFSLVYSINSDGGLRGSTMVLVSASTIHRSVLYTVYRRGS